VSGFAVGFSPTNSSLIASVPPKAVPAVTGHTPNQNGSASNELQHTYSGASTGTLSVDQKTKISNIAEQIIALVAKGDKAGAEALVQKHKEFIDTPGVSAALTKKVQEGIKENQSGDQSFLGKYGELMFLAARALIEGLNRRQSDGYWTQLGTALKGIATPAAKAVSIAGLSE
jgi:hypothetical protein